jgi:hypothetical protein
MKSDTEGGDSLQSFDARELWLEHCIVGHGAPHTSMDRAAHCLNEPLNPETSSTSQVPCLKPLRRLRRRGAIPPKMASLNFHESPEESISSPRDLPSQPLSEKKNPDIEVEALDSDHDRDFSKAKVYVPSEDAIFIDPRLENYPIPLVAKTVDLHNDPTLVILLIYPSMTLTAS